MRCRMPLLILVATWGKKWQGSPHRRESHHFLYKQGIELGSSATYLVGYLLGKVGILLVVVFEGLHIHVRPHAVGSHWSKEKIQHAFSGGKC